MTPDEFRRLALSMNDATEGAHMDHPDFRANGRIFATLYPNGHDGMVKLTGEQQQDFVSVNGTAFEPASGAWGRQGCTTVHLASVDEDRLGEAMTLAWQNTVKPPASGSSKNRRPAKATKQSRKR